MKLPCSHIFHVDCLKSWLIQQQICPTCRAEIPADKAKLHAAYRAKGHKFVCDHAAGAAAADAAKDRAAAGAATGSGAGIAGAVSSSASAASASAGSKQAGAAGADAKKQVSFCQTSSPIASKEFLLTAWSLDFDSPWEDQG